MRHVLPLFVHSCADIQKTSRGQADLILNIIARFFSDFNALRPESGGFPVGHGAQKADYVHPHGIQKQLLQKCILQFLFGEAAACQQCSSDWVCVCSRIIQRHSQCRCCDGIGTREVFAGFSPERVMSFFRFFLLHHHGGTGTLVRFAALTVFCIHCACESEGADYSLSMPSKSKLCFLCVSAAS